RQLLPVRDAHRLESCSSSSCGCAATQVVARTRPCLQNACRKWAICTPPSADTPNGFANQVPIVPLHSKEGRAMRLRIFTVLVLALVACPARAADPSTQDPPAPDGP